MWVYFQSRLLAHFAEGCQGKNMTLFGPKFSVQEHPLALSLFSCLS